MTSMPPEASQRAHGSDDERAILVVDDPREVRDVAASAAVGATPLRAAPPPDAPVGSLLAQVAAADRACERGDGEALAAALLPVLERIDGGLAIDLVAVIELANYDLELARARWSRLRSQLRT